MKPATALALLAVVMTAAIFVLLAAAALPPDKKAVAPEPKWLYYPVEKFPAAGGIVVVCQAKTNSRAFANHERAEVGDVLKQTCRATKAQPEQPAPKAAA